MSRQLADRGEGGQGVYPVALEDRHHIRERDLPAGVHMRDVRARQTGEYRAPKRGEWYLSGGPVEAYRAPSDLTMIFDIAELIYPERTVTTWKVISA